MPSVTREREKLLDARRRLHHLRRLRPAASHRHGDDVAVAREQPRDMRRDGGLADPLAGREHRQRRQWERRHLRRLDPEVGTRIRDSGREDATGEPEARRRSQHGLVREVEDELRLEGEERRVEVVVDGHSVVGVPAQLLGPSHHQRADELVRQLGEGVPHRRRIVLPVDQRQGPHVRAGVTSSSIRAVYFSNERVSVENWMIFSCPWNGYFRQTSTWWSVISIRL